MKYWFATCHLAIACSYGKVCKEKNVSYGIWCTNPNACSTNFETKSSWSSQCWMFIHLQQIQRPQS